MRLTRWMTVIVASLATVTAVSMSVLASWQRGGSMPERIVWIAVGAVLTTSVHVIPAISRGTPVTQRAVATLIWLCCIVTTCYGHVTFFLSAQRDAGAIRVSLILPPATPRRTLSAVQDDRASVVGRLAYARTQRCIAPCPSLEARISSLAAKQEALDAEVDEARRWQAASDRIALLHDAAEMDPVTALLTQISGKSAAAVNVLTGVLFALVVECLGSFLWWIASLSPDSAEVRDSHPSVVPVPTETSGQSPPMTELERLSHAVSQGTIRPTVSDIRQYLRCSQAKAASLRHQLLKLRP
ncbi:conserved membrane protein of unknown function [Pararobbsia alpina]|uniref:hypothetical protein n=1 Tax=Pararobbsia alpina TaxID=621374 RepID=UPI0039A720F6